MNHLTWSLIQEQSIGIQHRSNAAGTHHAAWETSSSVPVQARPHQGVGTPEENGPFAAHADASDAGPNKKFRLL
jgi:hypothetical protein